MAIILTILLVLANLASFVDTEMHCLVARPRFGLVSEVCPAHTVGCRIRIERNTVSFYEFYDRNQFVCVMKGEFGEQHGSGCVRKRSGSIRCWCFGRSDCNTPENSKLLLEAFLSGDEKKFHHAVQQVDFADLVDEEDQFDPIPSSTARITQEIHKTTPLLGNTSTDIPKTTTTTTTTQTSTTVPITTTTTKVVRTFHRHYPVKSHPTTKTTPRSSSSYRSHRIQPTTVSPAASNATVASEWDRQNRVHIIHVSTRDRYEPVNIFGSEAMKQIMAEESRRLKAEIADVSSEEPDEEEDDYSNEEEEDEVVPKVAPVGRRVAQRNSEMPKAAKKPKTAAKTRAEQRHRNSDEEEEELQNVLGDEYFDNSFVAPASALSHGLSALLAGLSAIAILFGKI